MSSEFYDNAAFGTELGLSMSWAWRYLMDDLKVIRIVPVNSYWAVLSKLDSEIDHDCGVLHDPSNLDQTKGVWGANGYRGDAW